MVSVGWQGSPDLDKIAELKPDLILMTGEQEDLYDELSEIAPTVGYQINLIERKPLIQMICSKLSIQIN